MSLPILFPGFWCRLLPIYPLICVFSPKPPNMSPWGISLCPNLGGFSWMESVTVGNWLSGKAWWIPMGTAAQERQQPMRLRCSITNSYYLFDAYHARGRAGSHVQDNKESGSWQESWFSRIREGLAKCFGWTRLCVHEDNIGDDSVHWYIYIYIYHFSHFSQRYLLLAD